MPEEPERGFVRPALATAGWALGLGAVVAGGAGLAAGVTDFRAPARGWLIVHGSGLTLADGRIGVVPLGAAGLVAVVIAVIARRFARHTIKDLGAFAGTVGLVYAIPAVVLAASTGSDAVSASIVRSAVGAFVTAGVGSALGAGWDHRADLIGGNGLRVVLRGTARALTLVFGVSLAVVVVLLALHGPRVAGLWALLNPGIAGSVLLVLICLLSLPTLVLWVASVLIGPGFVLGSNTSVDLTGSYLGQIPGFPMFAALPEPGPFPGWVLLLGAVLPVAGVRAGMITDRVRWGAAAGGLAGLVLGLLVAVSGGGIGPGRMAAAGPPAVTPALVAIVVLAATGASGSLIAHYRGRRVDSGPSTGGGLGLGGGDESAGPDRRGNEP